MCQPGSRGGSRDQQIKQRQRGLNRAKDGAHRGQQGRVNRVNMVNRDQHGVEEGLGSKFVRLGARIRFGVEKQIWGPPLPPGGRFF
jgi:hypothetical protein